MLPCGLSCTSLVVVNPGSRQHYFDFPCIPSASYRDHSSQGAFAQWLGLFSVFKEQRALFHGMQNHGRISSPQVDSPD